MDDQQNPYSPAAPIEEPRLSVHWSSTWVFQLLVCVSFLSFIVSANYSLGKSDWGWAYCWISLALFCISLVDTGRRLWLRIRIGSVLPFGVAGAFGGCWYLSRQSDGFVTNLSGTELLLALLLVFCSTAVGLGVGWVASDKLFAVGRYLIVRCRGE